MKKIFITTILSCAIISLILLIFFQTGTKTFLRTLVSAYGYAGIFGLSIVMDTIIQPISPDILTFGATFAGFNLVIASLVGGFGSCIAGILGYSIGHKAGADSFKAWFGEKHLHKGETLFKKYGTWAVVVGALSPIPYSAITWTAGIYRMHFPTFLITIICTRIPRFFIMGLIGYLLR